MDSYKIGVEKKIFYIALDFVTGLTDIVVVVRKPDGSLLSPAPTVTEQGDGTYIASYTPDSLGIWQEKITSVTNGDKAFRAYEVVSTDIFDIKSAVDSSEAKIDIIDGVVDATKTKVDSIDSKVDIVDTNVDDIKTKTNTIDGKIDIVDTNIDSTIAKADAIKTVVDSIEGKVNNLGTEIRAGGYFL